jgi:hypothetical protein
MAREKKAAPAKHTTVPEVRTPVQPEERRRMIAEAAYLRAEARGFQGGDPVQDWLEAEQEIDIRLMQAVPQPQGQAAPRKRGRTQAGKEREKAGASVH